MVPTWSQLGPDFCGDLRGRHRFRAPQGLHELAAVLAEFELGQAGVAVVVGVVESAMARLRLTRVPQFLIGACVVAAVGVLVLFTGGRP